MEMAVFWLIHTFQAIDFASIGSKIGAHAGSRINLEDADSAMQPPSMAVNQGSRDSTMSPTTPVPRGNRTSQGIAGTWLSTATAGGKAKAARSNTTISQIGL